MKALTGRGDTSGADNLELLLDAVPVLISYIDRDQRIQRVNRAYRDFSGVPDPTGLTIEQAAGPEHYSRARPYIERALRGEASEFESRVAVADGSVRDIMVSYAPDRDADGTVRGFVAMVQDITERKRAEALLAGQKRLLELITEGVGLHEALGHMCRLVENCSTSGARVSILLLDSDGRTLRHGAAPSLPAEYTKAIDGIEIGPRVGTCGRTAWSACETVTESIATDPCWADYRHLALPHNLQACWSTPIPDGAGRVLGTFALYYPAARPPDERDRTLVATVVQTAALAISRARAAEELDRARGQAHNILESISDAFFALDREWRFTYLNQAAERLLVRSRDQLLGRSIWEEFAPAVGTRFWHEYQRVMREGTPVHFEEFYAPLDTWFRVNAYPAPDGISVYFQNIGESRRAEMRHAFLVRLDDATRTLTAPDDIVQAMARLLAEHLDVQRCAWADVEEDENTFNLTGDHNRGVQSIVGRYTFEQFGEECLRLMRAGKPYIVSDSEADARTASVLEAYRLTSIRAVICMPLCKDGKFVAAMAVHTAEPRRWRPEEIELVRLVANRCWESIERIRVTRELREREQRLRLAQAVGRIGSFEYYCKQDCVIWTPELEALYGLPFGTFEGTFDAWRRRVVPEDAARVEAGMSDTIARREQEYGYEFRAVLPNGSQRWLRGQSHFVYDEAGAAERMIGVNIDIHAEKTAHAALLEANEELRRANADLEQFAFAAAHDLQEPLRIITTYTQLLSRHTAEGSERVRTYADTIVDASRRMSLLLQDLLAYTETSRETDAEERTVDLDRVARRAVSNLMASVNESGAEIAIEPLPPVHGREGHMLQLFQNLVGNAIKYRQPGVPPRIRISAERRGSEWLVRVADNGCGIAPEYRSQIFGVFKRLHGKDIPGTGIGLAICQRVVERAGGRIWAESAGPGCGSTFCFTLPALPA